MTVVDAELRRRVRERGLYWFERLSDLEKESKDIAQEIAAIHRATPNLQTRERLKRLHKQILALCGEEVLENGVDLTMALRQLPGGGEAIGSVDEYLAAAERHLKALPFDASPEAMYGRAHVTAAILVTTLGLLREVLEAVMRGG